MALEQERKLTVQLTKALRPTKLRLDRIVRELATTEESTALFYHKLNSAIRKNYRQAKKVFKDWSEEEIIRYYNQEISKQLNKFKKSAALKGTYINITKFKNKHKTKSTVNDLVDQTQADYNAGLIGGEKDLLQLSSLTQRKNGARGITDFQNKQRKELIKNSIDGKYIAIIDKNGKKRRYNLKSYSETVTRTSLRESSTLSVVNTTVGVGADLVQVSSHNTNTKFDAQFEGKIYSLSGKDPDFPKATFLPPFHPRCIHSISTIFRETLERRGIQKYIDFSDGKTDKPPNQETFKPVSERKFQAWVH